MKYGKAAQTKKAIYNWHEKFVETGCLCVKQKSGRPGISARNIERVKEAFTTSPRKSIRIAALELEMPTMTVWIV